VSIFGVEANEPTFRKGKTPTIRGERESATLLTGAIQPFQVPGTGSSSTKKKGGQLGKYRDRQPRREKKGQESERTEASELKLRGR